jgi:riboflavin transporter FmnP
LVITKFLLDSQERRSGVDNSKPVRRIDSVSLAGMAIFGALAVVLTILSQALGLNFPVLPYLQFDFGEIAIFLAFLIFGPIPAIVSGFIEFGTLMVIGENTPIGPPLKLASILSSLLGLWAGTYLASRLRNPRLRNAAGLGILFGILARMAAMTVANYYLIVFISKYFSYYSLNAIVAYYGSHLQSAGFTLTTSNALEIILGVTAIFNALQLLFAAGISYAIVRLPQVRTLRVAGRRLWIVRYIQKKE